MPKGVGAKTGTVKCAMVVLRIGGANFLHCLLADSIWLECAESLITK